MREILFRGKSKSTGEWVYSMTIANGTIKRKYGNIYFEVSEDKWVQVDPKTVGQYIGVKDKADKKIFEGDILNGFSFNVPFYVVSFHNGMFYLVYPIEGKMQNWNYIGRYFEKCNEYKVDFLIKGNVTENSELLTI